VADPGSPVRPDRAAGAASLPSLAQVRAWASPDPPQGSRTTTSSLDAVVIPAAPKSGAPAEAHPGTPAHPAPKSSALVSRSQAPTSQSLADLIYRIVTETEKNNADLRELATELEQIDQDIQVLRLSVGWEFEVASRKTVTDGKRRDARKGWTRRTDGKFRSPYNLYGDLDENESDFILRLKRSFLGPDHEKYVKIGLRWLDKMDTVIKKQKLRRDLHLGTFDTVLSILEKRATLPLLDEQIALTRRQLELLRILRKTGDALPKDVLNAEHELQSLEEQRLIDLNAIKIALRELRNKTGDPKLQLPTTFSLAAVRLRPPVEFDEQEMTSYALAGRVDYAIGRKRVEFAKKMANYMSWYWPKLDLEFTWTRFHGHRKWLDEYRRDKGRDFRTELTLNVPLNAPLRGWRRYKSFKAACEGYRIDLEKKRQDIADDVYSAYLQWQQAYLHYKVSQRRLEAAREEARETELVATQLPGEIKGIAEVKRLGAKKDLLEARASLIRAQFQLLAAEAHWDYAVGDSPIEEAFAPYAQRDRRAVEKIGWIRWWTSLFKP